MLQAVKDGGRDTRALEPDPRLAPSVATILVPGAGPVVSQQISVKRVGMSVEPMETFLR